VNFCVTELPLEFVTEGVSFEVGDEPLEAGDKTETHGTVPFDALQGEVTTDRLVVVVKGQLTGLDNCIARICVDFYL